MGTSPTGSASVLVVDGCADVRALVRTRLQLDGFDVVGEAVDGPGAVEAAARLRPGFVVLDVDVPGLGGPAGLAHLRAAAPETRLVVLSRFADPYTLHAVLDAGAEAYVDKVDGAPTLSHVLRALLDEDTAVPADGRSELDRVQAQLRALVRDGSPDLGPDDRARYDALVEREATLLAEQWASA